MRTLLPLVFALAACQERPDPIVVSPVRNETVAVSGHVAVPGNDALPDGAIVRVEARSPGAAAPLGETRVPTTGVAGPYPFEVKLRPTADVVELHASILIGDRIAYIGGPARVDRALASTRVGRIDVAVAPEAPSPRPIAFKAIGHEPSWSLDLGAETITFTALGAQPIAMPTPRRAAAGGKRVRWSGPAFRVEAVPVKCVDVATGLPYPWTVSVLTGDVTYDGCGGDPASLVTGAPWTIVEIGGAAVDAPEPLTLALDAEGRASGNSGCNQYATTYELTGEGLRFGPVAGTKRACVGPGADAEAALYAALAGVLTFEIDAADRLVLKAGDGAAIVAKR